MDVRKSEVAPWRWNDMVGTCIAGSLVYIVLLWVSARHICIDTAMSGVKGKSALERELEDYLRSIYRRSSKEKGKRIIMSNARPMA